MKENFLKKYSLHGNIKEIFNITSSIIRLKEKFTETFFAFKTSMVGGSGLAPTIIFARFYSRVSLLLPYYSLTCISVIIISHVRL